MCIKDNQSFNIVEHEGFRELLKEAEPRFKMPSRWTFARDCLKLYAEELVKLKKRSRPIKESPLPRILGHRFKTLIICALRLIGSMMIGRCVKEF